MLKTENGLPGQGSSPRKICGRNARWDGIRSQKPRAVCNSSQLALRGTCAAIVTTASRNLKSKCIDILETLTEAKDIKGFLKI